MLLPLIQAKRLEQGYETLFRWVQQYCRTQLDAATLDIPILVVRAVFELQHRPIYFDHIMQEICASRRVCLIRRFSHALTRGDGDAKGTPSGIFFKKKTEIRSRCCLLPY